MFTAKKTFADLQTKDSGLRAENISFSIATNTLLHPTNACFFPGKLYGILGPNGSGKSTFLKTLARIWKPCMGKVTWQGVNLHTLSLKEKSKIITLVAQNPSLQFNFTVSEIVSQGRFPHAKNYLKDAENLIDGALKTVDVWHLRNRCILSLSEGEKRRVFIARALITECPVLLLDEPMANLDIGQQLHVWELLSYLTKMGKTILIANHDLCATEKHCDEVMILKNGHTRAFCKTQAAFTDTLLKEVFGVESVQLSPRLRCELGTRSSLNLVKSRDVKSDIKENQCNNTGEPFKIN